MEKKTSILVLTITLSLSPALAVPYGHIAAQDPPKQRASISGPQCATIGKNELTITCAYTASSLVSSDSRTTPRIILDRGVISFVPSNESHMKVEFTFRNDSGSKITDQRAVYLAIDNDKGENQVRRPLPNVDFTRLEPGKLTKFQETLMTPAFSPGLYFISIWIPSTDSVFKFDPARNFLLSADGVPDSATGLNKIAKFTVSSSVRNKSSTKPD